MTWHKFCFPGCPCGYIEDNSWRDFKHNQTFLSTCFVIPVILLTSLHFTFKKVPKYKLHMEKSPKVNAIVSCRNYFCSPNFLWLHQSSGIQQEYVYSMKEEDQMMDEVCLQTPIWEEWLNYLKYVNPIISKATKSIKENPDMYLLWKWQINWDNQFFFFLSRVPQHYTIHHYFALLSCPVRTKKTVMPTLKDARKRVRGF